jgi:hypothetical protein
MMIVMRIMIIIIESNEFFHKIFISINLELQNMFIFLLKMK